MCTSCLSYITLSYLVALFKQGGLRPLTEDDVPALSNSLRAAHCASEFERNWNLEIAAHSKDKASLLRVLIKSFGTRMWRVFFLSIIFVACVTASPFFVNRLVRFFQGEAPQFIGGIAAGYLYSAGIWACFACVSFSVTHIYVNTTHMGHCARLGVINAVYLKSLRLSSSVGKTGGSGFVNLMTVDAERVWQGFLKMHLPGNTVAVVAVGCVELYVTAGYSGLFGLVVILLFIPLQSMVASAISKARRELSSETDLRVQLQT